MRWLLVAICLVFAAAPAGASGVPLGIAVGPWSGAGLTGSVPASDKFGVTVRGTPGAHVRLVASGLPPGWIGSWCTDRICAPFRATLDLPARGSARVEFQIVPPDAAAARRHPGARLWASDGASSCSVRLRA
jgi:hypothetical protein